MEVRALRGEERRVHADVLELPHDPRAVVVKPQAPAQRTWSLPAPAQPWVDAGTTPADARPPSHWVMPADNLGATWTGRLHVIVLGLFVVGIIVVGIFDAVSNASPLAPEDELVAATNAPGVAALSPLRVGECFDLENDPA
jgi:hypothetical protein